MIGVATDDERRKPVTSHVVAVSLAPRSRWMVVSAGTTRDCCSEKPRAIIASTISVISSPKILAMLPRLISSMTSTKFFSGSGGISSGAPRLLSMETRCLSTAKKNDLL